MWSVVVHPEAVAELAAFAHSGASRDRQRLSEAGGAGADTAVPHSSAIKDADRLRELRPRAGRSPWRAFYRQMGDVIFVVGAIGPEAAVKPRDFVRAVRSAEDRLNKIEQDEEGH